MSSLPFLRYFQPSFTLTRDVPFNLIIPTIDSEDLIIVSSSLRIISDELDPPTVKYYIRGSNFTDRIASFNLLIPVFIRPRRYEALINVKLNQFDPLSLTLDVDIR